MKYLGVLGWWEAFTSIKFHTWADKHFCLKHGESFKIGWTLLKEEDSVRWVMSHESCFLCNYRSLTALSRPASFEFRKAIVDYLGPIEVLRLEDELFKM